MRSLALRYCKSTAGKYDINNVIKILLLKSLAPMQECYACTRQNKYVTSHSAALYCDGSCGITTQSNAVTVLSEAQYIAPLKGRSKRQKGKTQICI